MQSNDAKQEMGEYLSRTLGDFRAILGRVNSDDDSVREEAYEEASMYGLGMRDLRVIRWNLYTGGPGGWIEYHIDMDGDVVLVEFHHAPWFDHASSVLNGDDFDAAVDMARAAGVLID